MAESAPGQHSAPNGTPMSPNGVDEDLISPSAAKKAHSAFPRGLSADFEPSEVRISNPSLADVTTQSLIVTQISFTPTISQFNLLIGVRLYVLVELDSDIMVCAF